MKNIKFIIVTTFILLSSSVAKMYAQPTSEEEYNYITKGYKVQVETGLDMKAGYHFKDLGDWGLKFSDGRRGFTFKALYRSEQTKPCAIMAIYERRVNGKAEYSEYYCIPSMDAEPLWDKMLEQINKGFEGSNSKQMFSGMVWALMKLATQEIGK